jgi:hypothetical protein
MLCAYVYNNSDHKGIITALTKPEAILKDIFALSNWRFSHKIAPASTQDTSYVTTLKLTTSLTVQIPVRCI